MLQIVKKSIKVLWSDILYRFQMRFKAYYQYVMPEFLFDCSCFVCLFLFCDVSLTSDAFTVILVKSR